MIGIRHDPKATGVQAYRRGIMAFRSGLAPHTFGNQVTTQAAVISQIELERRLELALEGDRWPDLVRLGRVIQVKGIQDRPGQALFPLPIRDLRVSPQLTQNPGY